MLLKIRSGNGYTTSIESTEIQEVYICENPNDTLEPGDKVQECPLAIIYTPRFQTGYRLNGEQAKAFIYWHDQNVKDLMAIYKASNGQQEIDKPFAGAIKRAKGLFANQRCHDCHNWVKDCICNS